MRIDPPTRTAGSVPRQKRKPRRSGAFYGGADDGDRTRDPQLGKLMLYQLSYVRAPVNDTTARRVYLRRAMARKGDWRRKPFGRRCDQDRDERHAATRPSAGGVRLTSTRPRRRQQGQTMAEYAVILGVITPVLVLLFSGLGEPIIRRLEMVTSFLL
jgi:Flp pilus assembly pilin Flp